MTRKKQSRLLVESILKGDTLRANGILAKLISEAEEERLDLAKDEAEEELGILDDLDLEDEFDADGEELDADDEDSDTSTDDEFSNLEDLESSDTELNDLVDKQVNFEVQINNLVLNDLQNKCADLKTALLNNTTLDKHSREFYEIKIPLQYYALKLAGMKKDITPLVNQDEMKKQLDEISSSLQELEDKIGDSNDSDEDGIATPNEIVDKELGTEF